MEKTDKPFEKNGSQKERKGKPYKFKQVEIRLKVKEGQPLYSTEPVNCPEAAVKLLADYMKDMDRECVYVLNFDNAMRPLSFHLTSMGGSNYAPVDPANIFKSAMLTNSSYLMVMHVHPSGSLKPSRADIESTEKISLIGCFLQIPVRDHLIVSGGSGEYISLKAEYPQIFHELKDPTEGMHSETVKQPDEIQDKQSSEEKGAVAPESEQPPCKELSSLESEQPPCKESSSPESEQPARKESASPEEGQPTLKEPSSSYNPLALTYDQRERLFEQEAPEALELAKMLEIIGNENNGATIKEDDPLRRKWLLNTAQDIKDGNTDTIKKAVNDISQTTENIAITRKAVDFLIKLEAVKGKWEPAPQEVVSLFEQKEPQKPETVKVISKSENIAKAKNKPVSAENPQSFTQKLEAAQQKADALNASRSIKQSISR